MEVLIEAVPGLRRMATLADANNTTVAKLDALREGARAHNIELSIHQVTRGEEIAAAIDNAQTSGATALNVLSSPLFFAHLHLILDRAAALRLPAIYDFPEMADEGGFAAYGPRLSQFFVKVMPQQIVKLFKGAKVADVPVEQPTTDPTNFEHVPPELIGKDSQGVLDGRFSSALIRFWERERCRRPTLLIFEVECSRVWRAGPRDARQQRSLMSVRVRRSNG